MLSPVTDGEPQDGLPTALHRLREAVHRVELPLATPERERAEIGRRELLTQLDDYLVPRADAVDGPLLAVVAGSTGAGKSTLVNSILGSVVCRAGAIRPTTTVATLVHHPDDTEWSDRVLPGLARSRETHPQPGHLRLVASAAVPRGLALLDAPDIDSVVSAHRDLALHLLSAADLWICVTTAVRYADAAPWRLLHRAIERGSSVAVVLDRVPVDAMEEVRADVAGMLADQGLTQSPVFALVETGLSSDGLLPVTEVTRMRSWLHSLAADRRARTVVVRSTFDGVLASLAERCGDLRDAAAAQRRAVERLHRMSHHAFEEAGRGVQADLEDGSIFRGEVLARWQELVGTGEVLRQLDVDGGRLRRALDSMARGSGSAQTVNELRTALHTALVTVLRNHAERACQVTCRGWRSSPGGGAVLRDHPGLAHPTDTCDRSSDRGVHDWQDAVVEMVRDAAGGRRATARYLAFGVDGLGVMLMLIVTASPGSTGTRHTSAILAQRLLEALFTADTVATLTGDARRLLRELADRVYAEQQAAFDDAVPAVAEDAGPLDDAVSAVEEAR